MTTLTSLESGLDYTASNTGNVEAFEAALTSYLASHTDTMAQLENITDNDVPMPMALCFQGYLLKLAAHPRFEDQLRNTITRTRTVMTELSCTERERAHLEVLILWVNDQANAALQTLETILEKHPLDMLALRIAHYLHFYNGASKDMRDSVNRVRQKWSVDHPQYGYLLGMYAFGLEESGDYEAAESFGREAVERNRADIWATHAVTHVYEMCNRHVEGINWVRDLRVEWHDTNNFRYHLFWHQALHHLGLDDPDEALNLYDVELTHSLADDFYLDLCNNAALLWRLEFAGLDVGDRWHALTEIAGEHTKDKELLFASLHYLIPLALKNPEQANTLLDTIRQWASMSTDQGQLCAELGLSLAVAVNNAKDKPEQSATALAAQSDRIFKIGGSHAQRDLFRLLARDCAERSNRPDLIPNRS